MNNYESFITDIVKDYSDQKLELLLRQSKAVEQTHKLYDIVKRNYHSPYLYNEYFHKIVEYIMGRKCPIPTYHIHLEYIEYELLCDALLKGLDDEVKLSRIERLLTDY